MLMFGMGGAGKSHLLYTGLLTQAGPNGGEKLLQPSYGFNCEYVVGARDSFNLWDVSGQPELLSQWPLYA